MCWQKRFGKEVIDTDEIKKTIFGTPDISFKGLKISIFYDSEFWYGKDWQDKKRKIGTNTEYWERKFKRNIQRNKEVN